MGGMLDQLEGHGWVIQSSIEVDIDMYNIDVYEESYIENTLQESLRIAIITSDF